MPESDIVRYIETGKKVYHSQFCGRCHGAGCPQVRVLSDEDATRVGLLENYLKDMDIPFERRDLTTIDNLRWLWKNIPSYNLDYVDQDITMRLVYELLMGQL